MSTAESPVRFEDRPIVIVMGVSGSGKSTVGAALAERLGVPFLDADDFHPKANVEKMSNGIPLTDEDRWPWLDSLSQGIRDEAAESGGVVAACSALKLIYRDRLREGIRFPLTFALLDGNRDQILRRMEARKDHYMPASLLDSQLADLERPDAHEVVVTVTIDDEVEHIVDHLLANISMRL